MKKAEISTSMIVTLLIILMGFALILIFWTQISWTGQVDSQVCHQSVILRGSLPTTANSKDFVPLKCKTNKICITAGVFGGKCKEFENSNGITTVKVSDVHQMEKVVADNIIDCWKMMGEGKVNLFSRWMVDQYGFGTVYPSCVICDRVAFDVDGLKKAGIKLEDMNVEEYMKTRAIAGKDISYYDYLAGENGKVGLSAGMSIPDYQDVVNGKLVVGEKKIGEGDVVPLTNENAPSDSKELAIMFMQITAPTHGGSATNIGEVALLGVAGSFVTAPVTTYKAGLNLGKACVSGPWAPVICAAVLVVAGVVQQGAVARNRALTAGYCGDVSSGGDERNGCSVVRTTNYDASAIKSYCSIIESIP